MRWILFILYFLSWMPVRAQEELQYLDWVEISDQRHQPVSIDTLFYKTETLSALSNKLQRANGVYIRNYGPSNIATLSIRGTDPVQNQVLYRDLNLNSAFLGLSDLSLFNSAVGNAQLQKGISTLEKNSGAFGGVLQFESRPRFTEKKRHLTDVQLEGGSFHTYRAQIAHRYSSNKISHQLQGSYDRSKNNFQYKNPALPDAPLQRQQDAAFQRINLHQDLALKLPRQQKLEIGGAYFFMDRSIPPALLTSDQNEDQTDHMALMNIQYQKIKAKHAFRTAAYYKYQYIQYNNELALINSLTNAHTSLLIAEHNFAIRPNFILSSKIENQTDWVRNENLADFKNRNRLAANVLLKHQWNNYLSWTADLRQEFYNDFVAPFLFHAGMKIYPLGKSSWSIGLDGGRNFRYPTLNDLYWVRGGNPDIEPEKSWGGEWSSAFSKKVKRWRISTHHVIYYYKIENQIRWLPGSAGYWEAQNISNVTSWGYEPKVNLAYFQNDFEISVHLAYHLNNSFEGEERWQRIYVPRHQFKPVLFLNYKGYFAEIAQEWTSQRFLSRDNSIALDPYYLLNVSVGKTIAWKKHELLLQLNAENLTNASYVLYSGRPMPMRAFYATVKYTLK